MCRRTARALLVFTFMSGVLTTTRIAQAQEPASDPNPNNPNPNPSSNQDTKATTAAPPTDATTTETANTPPTNDPERKDTLIPKAAEPAPLERTTFDADPIADGAIVLVGAGFAGLLELVNGTGEIRPQQISPTFERSQLLGIDRGALSQHIDPNAGTYSTIGLFAACGFALIDPIATGLREKNVQSGLVDGILYGESIAVTWGVTNLAKMAVRRPRPIAYIDAEAHKGDPNYSNADTDSTLSFFSGHASMVGAISATATYLAFARAPKGSVRPWVTMIVGAGLTSFVSYERVRAGKHFPTDVIAGSIAGIGVGIIVPHLHRSESVKQRPVWVGFTPASEGQGGTVQLSGVF